MTIHIPYSFPKNLCNNRIELEWHRFCTRNNCSLYFMNESKVLIIMSLSTYTTSYTQQNLTFLFWMYYWPLLLQQPVAFIDLKLQLQVVLASEIHVLQPIQSFLELFYFSYTNKLMQVEICFGELHNFLVPAIDLVFLQYIHTHC